VLPVEQAEQVAAGTVDMVERLLPLERPIPVVEVEVVGVKPGVFHGQDLLAALA